MSDRKYRQRGYQDDPRDREKTRERAAPKPIEPRAPGRQLQDAAGPKTPNLMASHEVFRCSRCGNRLALPVEADGRCSRCGVGLHSCIQCASFDTSARFECAQTLAARVVAEGRAQHVHAVLGSHDDRTADRHARARKGDRARGRRLTICSSNWAGFKVQGSRSSRGSPMGLLGAADQERLRERVRGHDAAGAAAVLHADARLRDLPADAPDPRRAAAAVRPGHDRRGQLRPRARQGETVRGRPCAGRGDRRPGRSGGRARLEDPLSRRAVGLRVRRRSFRPCCSSAACPATLSADSLTRVAAVSTPVTVRVFTTPTCPHCPARRERGARDGVRQPQHHGLSPSRPRSFPISPGGTRSRAFRKPS